MPGEVVGILGANGAGKTTTLLALAGALPLFEGEVRLYGQPTSSPLHIHAAGGLSFVPEDRSVFMQLSVKENLRLGRIDPEQALVYFPELQPLMARTAGLLSGGEQQMLTLARRSLARPGCSWETNSRTDLHPCWCSVCSTPYERRPTRPG